MLDFLRIDTRISKNGVVEIFPKFIICKTKDLMIKGGDFYAIYREDKGLWSTEEQDVVDMIDNELDKFAKEYKQRFSGTCIPTINIQYMSDGDSGMINKWHSYCQKQCRDYYKPLNQNLVFINQTPTKNDYATSILPYALEPGDISAYDELMNTLYSEENRHKIEWIIGSIVNGDSKKIHKFLVLYGPPGTGKSTVIDIIKALFDGYYTVFDARSLGSSSNNFAMEPFRDNPLVAIQTDGDLSRIDDNTRLNSITAHEKMTINEKNKSLYNLALVSMLVMASNDPVKITNAKSGMIRRLIDVNPTGNKIPVKRFNELIKQIQFELGAIAYHCKEVYENNLRYYDDYKPLAMMGETNDFFNFMEANFLIFKAENQMTLKEIWEMYQQYCEDAKVPYPYSMRLVKAELKSYFREFEEDHFDEDTNTHTRCLYTGFKYEMFEKSISDLAKKVENKKEDDDKPSVLIDFKEQHSKLDDYLKDCPAQYATLAETPSKKWENVTTTLKDLDTSKLHYVRPPEILIVIDFDLKDKDGKKSYQLNLEAASKWPKTYAELSKSGSGIHLHYIYDGDINKLSRFFEPEIEIKIFTGNSSLRRKLVKCNNEDIAHISSGLPLREIDKMEDMNVIKNEKMLRTMIIRNLNKEYMGATAPSVSFIKKLLDDAYNSGMPYDVSDLYNHVLNFAMNSTNQSENCLKIFAQMKWKSDDTAPSINNGSNNKPMVFFDCEVFPNLLVVCYKLQGKHNPVHHLINPTIKQINELINNYRLVGFNNRKYDNHILYAALLGKSNWEIYQISKKLINNESKSSSINSGTFGNAFNISYTDIYDYCSNDNKISLKKWEIRLHILHRELGLSWDEPVPEEKWDLVVSYCKIDVIATEAVFDATQADFTAREILAEITGMTVNDTTNSLTTKFIFGNERKPLLVYTDLSKTFPGYEFIKDWDANKHTYIKHNMYRGIDLGFGGYVDAGPGMYFNVALLDIVSMHPHSAIALNAFGEYTKRFEDLVKMRKYIKHKEYDKAKQLFDGKLAKYLEDPTMAKKLSNALKTAINSVYGLSSAAFENPFKHPDNENNIVALRGALFMKTLQDEVVKRGYVVIHIKTDSIKIVEADNAIINFCKEFAKKYGYEFEHEATYDRICLVNDAVYIARYSSKDWCMERYGYIPEKNESKEGQWCATGTQFAVPYVFKKCFSKEKIVFDDLCETKTAKTALFLDKNEKLDNSNEPIYKKVLDLREEMRTDKEFKLTKQKAALLSEYDGVSDEDIKKKILNGHECQFVGKVGCFIPVKVGCDGGKLVVARNKANGNVGYDAVTGCKDYRWVEAADVQDNYEDVIDYSYYDELANDAIDEISKYGDYYAFVNADVAHAGA